SANTC
ncbi:elongation factor Tu GTP binding domain protein, partial [Vibrio parahaemolyticus EKP-026]